MRLTVSTSEFDPMNYYSGTHDVLVVRGDEEDARVVVIARCESHEAANALIDNLPATNDFVIGIRPPHRTVVDALAWLNVCAQVGTSGLTIEHR